MTCEEIRQELESLRAEAQRIVDSKSSAHIAGEYLGQVPLWEIAYQLATMNEGVCPKCLSLDRAEPGKTKSVSEPCEVPVGFRCTVCNYDRPFCDLLAKGRDEMRAGRCPSCGNFSRLQIIFEPGKTESRRKSAEAQESPSCSNCKIYGRAIDGRPSVRCPSCDRLVLDWGQFFTHDRDHWPVASTEPSSPVTGLSNPSPTTATSTPPPSKNSDLWNSIKGRDTMRRTDQEQQK